MAVTCRADDNGVGGTPCVIWRPNVAGLASVNPSTVLTASDSQVTALHGFWHEHANVLIVRPLQILAVILVALVVRAIVNRFINRLTKSSAEGKIPKILSPLTERAANSNFWEATGLVSERRRQRAETIGSVLRSAVSVLIFVTAVLVILGLLQINLGPFIAGTSIVGVALGFGAQNIVKDFLSGIFMLLEDQYGVGDVIDVKEATGTVEAVGLRTTKLRDAEGTAWYVRNGEIVRVGNKSQQFAQVVLDVPIGVTDDLAVATGVIHDSAEAMYNDERWQDSFMSEPEVLGVESLSREETVIRVVARVRPLEQWRVARELRARIRRGFDEARLVNRILGDEPS
jgi:small-conductance mechanosensitive channel